MGMILNVSLRSCPSNYFERIVFLRNEFSNIHIYVNVYVMYFTRYLFNRQLGQKRGSLTGMMNVIESMITKNSGTRGRAGKALSVSIIWTYVLGFILIVISNPSIKNSGPVSNLSVCFYNSARYCTFW